MSARWWHCTNVKTIRRRTILKPQIRDLGIFYKGDCVTHVCLFIQLTAVTVCCCRLKVLHVWLTRHAVAAQQAPPAILTTAQCKSVRRLTSGQLSAPVSSWTQQHVFGQLRIHRLLCRLGWTA
jgi:hypothetical protein